MRFIARTLPAFKPPGERLSRRRTLDHVLIESAFVSNLRKEDTSELQKAEVTLREVLAIDLLAEHHGRGIVKETINQTDVAEYFAFKFIEQAGDGGPGPTQRKKGLLTPMKLLASKSYISLLRHDESKRLLPEATRIDEFKGIAFYDLLFSQLTRKRRHKLEEIHGVFKSIEKAALLYIFQRGAKEIKRQNRKIGRLLAELGGADDINPQQYSAYDSFVKKSPPEIGGDIDPEATKLLEERKESMERLGEMVHRRVTALHEGLDLKISGILPDVEVLEGRESLDKENIEELANYSESVDSVLRSYEEIPPGTGVSERAVELKNRIRAISEAYDESREEIPNLIKYQRELEIIVTEIRPYVLNQEYGKMRKLLEHSRCFINYMHERASKRYCGSFHAKADELEKRIYSTSKEVLGYQEKVLQSKLNSTEKKVETSGIVGRLGLNAFRNGRARNCESELEEVGNIQRLLEEEFNRH